MKTKAKRNIVLTAALPYANGNIHIGHLVEYLQADFWTRFQKMQGNKCLYLCADDTHGTPIMLRARQDGITPEALIKQSHAEHIKDFSDFEISFDNYYSTHSDINREFSEFLFKKLEEKDHLAFKAIDQSYCEHDKMFLPDRFVKGICPNCKSVDQYGDNCDNCSATYAPTDLIEPYCSICKNAPVLKSSEHIFFKINDFKDYLNEWLPEHNQKEVSNKLMEWFDEDLRDWDISRDAPYFGFEIPGHEGKYFYVWLDAPVGYMASCKDWCNRNGKEFDDVWNNPDNELYHFIGKDIVRFHCMFWPAILHNAGVKTPDKVFVHGFLTVNGEKMSKSKGTFVSARTYLNHLDPMYLRFYYACKLNPSTDDIDLSFEDFVAKVNSELMGKVTNLASRGAQMLHKQIDGKLGSLKDKELQFVSKAQSKSEEIAKHYEDRNFAKALVIIRELADEANRYFDEAAPWSTVKTDPEAARDTLSCILNVFRVLAVYLKPILPEYTKKVETLFNDKPYSWASAQDTKENCELNKYEYLASKIDMKEINKIMEETISSTPTPATDASGTSSEISIDDFSKIDLRIGEIIEAKEVEGADKLLQITLNIGEKTINVFAGIKAAYNPQDLIGKHVVTVANLKHRKMKFGTSEGMILAAGTGGEDLFLVSPDDGAKAGHKVK